MMGLQTISWEGYWLDDAWLSPGKTHAFIRGVGYTSDRALCGYEPKWNANTMYHDNSYCKRCEAKVAKLNAQEK